MRVCQCSIVGGKHASTAFLVPPVHTAVAMETDPPMTPEAQSQVVAKKALKQLKRHNWNIPDRVPLTPGREVVVGRCSDASVVMHSPKLPAMLSRRHAALRYSPDNEHWLVEDLKVKQSPCTVADTHIAQIFCSAYR